jgi:nucleolar protein 4
MFSKKDAQKAMEGCNGMNVSAGMAEGLVSDKQKRKKIRREEAKRRKGEIGEEETDVGTGKERTIAVDWALSKERWEEEQGKLEKGSENDEEVGESDSSSDEDEEDGDALGVLSNSSGSEDSQDDQGSDSGSGSDNEKPVKPQLPPPESGTTLFIRNVPFSATDDELRALYVFFSSLRLNLQD